MKRRLMHHSLDIFACLCCRLRIGDVYKLFCETVIWKLSTGFLFPVERLIKNTSMKGNSPFMFVLQNNLNLSAPMLKM